MTVEHIEALVEEPSMEVALRLLMPKLLPGVSFQIHPYQGKPDLLRKLPHRLVGYAKWIPKTYRVVVVVDRDDDDCEELKLRLEEASEKAALLTWSMVKPKPCTVLNRLAIEELEAWYFGDWRAVRRAYPRAPANIPAGAKYRAPDAIKGGTWETFERVLQSAGYFVGGLRKIEAARAIAEHMQPARSTSPSFCALRDALAEWAI